MNTISLREQVQSFRDNARDILRMEKIAASLQDLFYTERNYSKTEKYLNETLGKKTARQEYKISQLDPENPDFETLKEKEEKTLKTIIRNEKEEEKNAEQLLKELNEEIKTINKEIEDLENGKTKVDIDAVAEITQRTIANLHNN